ncbi:MAG: tRNA uridine-5-carboxymethylaminomethyl(34) synthesis GTPase MnmE [Firmicutes bacterium]|nr:tRNA uridine-5-carboxymethylaminomethyl(34) synthesis GTPase MnmE [Bacillota bacterium]
MLEDTIAAISTPIGGGGIGIIRISGPEAIKITEKIFKPAVQSNWREKKFKLVYGQVVEPGTQKIIDEVLLGVMPAPYSYTREDVVEINCHGGPAPLRKVLEKVLQGGARLAEPGEFTKRAFLNGRLDLARAEAIIDIIRATTDDALQLAVNQLSGALSLKLEQVQAELLNIVALVEAAIDFPEDEVEEYSDKKISDRLEKLLREIENLLAGAEAGKIYREGIRTVIVGKPNVGKSSLLNVLLREKRAIVTDVPGTTRDIIEEVLNLGGVPVVLMDTAGIRETKDAVEKIGVERTRATIEMADLVLVVLDAAGGIDREDEEILSLVGNKRGVMVLNKIDVNAHMNTATRDKTRNLLPGWPMVEISALQEQGIRELENTVVELVTGGRVITGEGVMVTNVRHKNQLVKAREHLSEAIAAIQGGLTPELVAIDVRGAWEAMGEINGSIITEDIVDKIFADFCIGK